MENRIEELRREEGLNQKEFAKLAGISRATLWAIETGRNKTMLASTMMSIAAALHRPVNEVFYTENV